MESVTIRAMQFHSPAYYFYDDRNPKGAGEDVRKRRRSKNSIMDGPSTTQVVMPSKSSVTGRSRRQIISSHSLIKDSMKFHCSCLPWYHKKLLVFQINDLRKRLAYLLKDSYYLKHTMILPQAVPIQLRGYYQNKTVKRVEEQPKNVSSMRAVLAINANESVNKSKGHILALFRNDSTSSKQHPQCDEKENIDVLLSAIIKTKRERVLRAIRKTRERDTLRVKDSSHRFAVNHKQRWRKNSLLSSSISSPGAPTSWFMRPNSDRLTTGPTYCSMEMISFDKQNECFHRTEIAYPFEPQRCISSPRPVLAGVHGKSSHKPSCRRLAKRVEIRTAAVNNIYKHSLIWN